jgi:hypothetical protein
MAKLDPPGAIPWYVASCYRYRAADERELANNIYGDLGSEDEQAVARWRRQASDRDVHYLNHVLRTGDVPEEPPAQLRPRTTLGDLARAIYSDEFDAYRERYARWEQNLMWPFVRKGK